MPNDLRTRAIVLRRTNYGETDRILSLLTPEGKVAAIARGARKERSRLAGGIELFSVADVVVHQGRSGLGILTGAKMLKFYRHIMSDLARLELAGTVLKMLDRAAEQVTTPEHFELLEQVLQALDQGADLRVVTAWFNLNLQRAGGEEFNLIRDVSGRLLDPDLHYLWDTSENALRPDPRGTIGAPEIKLARFLLSHQLAATLKINRINELIGPIYEFSKLVL